MSKQEECILSARFLIDIHIDYDRYFNEPSDLELIVIPDLSVSHTFLRRVNSAMYIGIGFSTDWMGETKGYVPIGAEYFINKDFSFFTPMCE